MLLNNNTPQQLFYSISSTNYVDCGTINAGDTTDLPAYDDQTNVAVSFFIPTANPSPAPYVINIPATGTGKAVTIGLFVE
jgi:hypothetical protein